MKVFLGGTCSGYDWRSDLIPLLDSYGIESYNPIIKGRKRIEADQKKEIDERNDCDLVLYCITSGIRGVYSIAEVIDDSNKQPRKTLFFFFPNGVHGNYPLKGMDFSLGEVGMMVRRNGGRWFKSYEELTDFFENMSDKLREDELAYTE